MRADGLRLPLDESVAADALMLAWGAYAPLTGFLGEEDYLVVLNEMRLRTGEIFPLPIVLPVGRESGQSIRPGDRVLLDGPDGMLAQIEVQETFPRRKDWEAWAVYRTDSLEHPGIARLAAEGDLCLAGPVSLVRPPVQPFAEPASPDAVRREIAARGWRKVVAFQTRNPLHRAHEHLLKSALEQADGLLVHPLVGPTKDDDVPAAVRMACYRRTLRDHFPPQRTLLATFPAAMRYAGPREALYHAIVRRNYGATHFIVGRDAAGVGSFYGPDEARQLVERLAAEIRIEPVAFDAVGYCPHCEELVSARTCPHRDEWLQLAGRDLRRRLVAGDALPRELVRPAIAAILREHYRTA